VGILFIIWCFRNADLNPVALVPMYAVVALALFVVFEKGSYPSIVNS